MLYSRDSEIAVLGALLSDSESIYEVEGKLEVKDFGIESHQVIYQAMMNLHEKKIALELNLIVTYLTDRQLLGRMGGIDYLVYLLDSATITSMLPHYIDDIKDKSKKRQLENKFTKLMGEIHNPDIEFNDLKEAAEKELLNIDSTSQKSSFKSMGDVLHRVDENLQKQALNKGEVTGLKTGFASLDKMTAGLQKPDLIIIGARPAMGKTAFALNLAQNVSELNDVCVAVFSLEMNPEQLATRMLASKAKIDNYKFKTSNLSADDWRAYKAAKDRLSQDKIFINDKTSLKISDIKNSCRELNRQHRLGLVVIDYIQLINSSNKGSRQEQVSEISRLLKEMALELNAPVIALSQVSRQVEAREDKRPVLSDLRESGGIEQDADAVIFLYREDYYKSDVNEVDAGLVEVIFAKHRNGSVGTLKLMFDKEYSLFRSLPGLGV